MLRSGKFEVFVPLLRNSQCFESSRDFLLISCAVVASHSRVQYEFSWSCGLHDVVRVICKYMQVGGSPAE